MIRRIFLSAIILTLVCGSAALALEAGPRCGTHEPTQAAMEAVQARLDALLAERGPLAEKALLTVPIAFHVLYYEFAPADYIGMVEDSVLYDQIDVLNAAYGDWGIQFTLASIDRTDNKDWCKMGPASLVEQECKTALAVDPATTLNIYTGDLPRNLLGWSWFPDDWPEDSIMHGVVLHYESLPGGDFANYDEGDTATHEIGHYMGLYHTFQGGCNDPNDYCDDTPQEATASYGCPVGQDSCPDDPGEDPIHNFMDYTYDVCMYEFTEDQSARMAMMVETYRPTLWAAGTASPVWDMPPRHLDVRMTIAPNPFNPRTEISFTLTRSTEVKIRIFDLAGRQVSTLLDRHVEAGDHSVAFNGQGLASGVYLVHLLTGNGQELRDQIVLLR